MEKTAILGSQTGRLKIKNQVTVILNLKPNWKGLYDKQEQSTVGRGTGFLVVGRASDTQPGSESISASQQLSWVTIPWRQFREQQSICHWKVHRSCLQRLPRPTDTGRFPSFKTPGGTEQLGSQLVSLDVTKEEITIGET